jgi:hypothetical protein
VITDYIGAALLIVGLIGLLYAFGAIALTRTVLARVRQALLELRAVGLDDEAKAKLAQQASLRLFSLFGGIILRAAAACLLVASAACLLGAFGFIDLEGVIRAALSPQLGIAAVVGAVLWLGVSAMRRA